MARRDMARGGVVLLALALGAAYLVRPIFHGLVMLFYKSPLVWLPSALILAAAAAWLVYASSGKREIAAMVRGRRLQPGRVIRAALVAAGVAFLGGAIANLPLTARSIYEHTAYSEIGGLPDGGVVRLLPKEVAVQIASSGFNSPTEHLTDFHIVRTGNGLAWTAFQTPDGIVRTFAKKTRGMITLDASSTERRVTSTDAELQTAPRILVTDNLTWRLLKRHYLIDLTDPAAVLDREGKPVILVPYLKYRGLLVRRPVLGGVFVVHPSGRIEDLSPAEARGRPEIARSGRLFPEQLARRIHDAYAYKRGIWNRFVTHEEQTQITDTGANRQPYLLDFGARGAKWVTVAEPWGRAFAVNSIFLTDTVTGATEIWRVPRGQSLSGNRRAVQTVRSVSIPGVVFAAEDAEDASGGKFKVIEPRPVFAGGRLVYLLSIIPESGNSVSKSVIVDAARNKVVAIFDNDSDPAADEKTIGYLASGEVPGEAQPGGGERPAGGDRKGGTGAAPGGTATENTRRKPGSEPLARRLDRLIQRQREVLREAEALRESLPGTAR